MKENILRYSFKENLPEKVLEEIVFNFDKTHYPINRTELTKKPSDFAYKTPELVSISGFSNLTDQVELFRFPPKGHYLEIKGTTLISLAEDVLTKHKIKYDSNLTSLK